MESSQHEVWAKRAEGWIRDTRVLDHVFAEFTAALLAAADLPGSRRVLDVGCGAGTLLEEIAEHGATPVGVDISAAMTTAAAERVSSATVVTADAQRSDLVAETGGERFDRVISRFGVMFFDDPVAAFANIRAATAAGARLAFVSWRAEETDQFRHGLRALIRHLDQEPVDPAPGEPGPLGLPTESRIREVLEGAGWSDASVEAVDAPCDFGIDGSDGVEERLSMVLNGTVGQKVRAQLEPGLGPDGWARAVEEARSELRENMVDGRVQINGQTWLVTATNDQTNQ